MIFGKFLIAGLVLFGALPSTANYKLNGYGFGSGGTANSTTATYALEGGTGEISGQTGVTTTYNLKPAFTEMIQARTPQLTAFDNGSSTYYNKLHFVIDEQGNPSDALYLLQISTTSNFSSGNSYIQNDLTLNTSLVLSDYQTYSFWGGASGANIIGLSPSTTYYLRVKATQGKYTESAFGPSSTAATVGPQLSFSISTNSLAMGSLLPGTVVDAPGTIDITFATNATSGGDVYINGLNTGLSSAHGSSTIPSATGDLSVLTHGFGARVTATGASSGTFASVSPYNGVTNNVGLTDTTIRRIFSGTTPIVGGTGSVLIKAKSSSTDPAAADYSETLTMLASATF